MTEDPRATVSARIAGAGLATDDRFIVCEPGSKAALDHDRREGEPPTERNYGIYATARDRLVLLDVDDYGDETNSSGLAALANLSPTFEAASPHGGTHRYYAVETTEDGRLPAAVLKDEFGKANPAPTWGEVRVANQYVVGPGSSLDECDKEECDRCADPDGGRYTINADRSIATIPAEELVDALRTDPNLAPDENQTKLGESRADPAAVPHDLEGRLQTALKNDGKLARLWRGDTSDYGGDRSRAECALAAKLGWWFGNDKRTVRTLLDRSGAEKWAERPDDSYRESVLEAVDANTDHYEPNGGPQWSPTVADELAKADGGVTADDSAGGTDLPERTPWEVARERIRHEVAIPHDPPDDYEGEVIDKRTAVDRTANIYHEAFSWVRPREDTRGWRSTLYNYVPDEGIYEPHGEAEIERMIDAHLGPAADNQFVNEVVAKVERKARVRAKRFEEDPEHLVVANGVLDLTTGDLDDHSPAEFHRTRLDVEYDPDAECPAIGEFLNDVVHEADVPKLYRFIAHALYRGYPESKAAMLLGEGENGKTTFLNLVEAFLGEFNVLHESLKKLNEYEWSPARLNGKLANIDADMSDQSPDSMGMFKRLTGGDPIHGEVKFEKPVKFTNHATLIFACNEMPVLHDDTRGNWRRWQLIQFPYVFDEDDPDAKDAEPTKGLKERLFDETEFAGLLARCVEEISAWADGRAFFPDADSWEATRNKMRKAAEPVYDFAHACLRPSDDGEIPKEDARKAYQQYATDNGLKKLGPEEFGKRFLNLRDFSIDTKRVRDGRGGRPRVYAGVEFTERGKQILKGNTEPDGQQVGLGTAEGRRAKIDRVKEALRKNDGEMDRDDLVASYAGRHNVDPDDVEHALELALRHGDVFDPGGGVIRLT